jgi:replication factor C large subunit
VNEKEPWTKKYKPKNNEFFIGNHQAVKELTKWLNKWKGKPPKKKGAFIYGPPGIGKTSIAQVLANEYGFELIEVNASDKRNKGSIEEFLGKNIKQNVDLFGKKRLILLDEMDGLSGSQDRGGISAITKILEETLSPIILVANTIKENMDRRFSSLLRKTKNIEFEPLKSGDIRDRLLYITKDQEIRVPLEVLDQLSIRSKGDLRSAINDLETISKGKKSVAMEDIKVLGDRDRLDYTPNILTKIFTSRNLKEARDTIDQSMISYDDLFDWIYENIPIVIDDPKERLNALEIIAKADIYQSHAKAGNWRLLKYMFDLMTGGIAFSRKNSKGEGYKEQLNSAIYSVGFEPSAISIMEVPEGIMIKPNRWLGKGKWKQLNKNLRSIGADYIYSEKVWILPYYREPQTKWRYIFTYHQRRRLESLSRQLAYKLHTSTNEVKKEILPFIRVMIENDKEMYNDFSNWITNIPISKLNNFRYTSFDKGPRDFVNLENYSRYKKREMDKMIDKAKEQRKRDLSNINRWLKDIKENANWEGS